MYAGIHFKIFFYPTSKALLSFISDHAAIFMSADRHYFASKQPYEIGIEFAILINLSFYTLGQFVVGFGTVLNF